MAQAAAGKIRQRLGDSLPQTEQILTRNPSDKTHRGKFFEQLALQLLRGEVST